MLTEDEITKEALNYTTSTCYAMPYTDQEPIYKAFIEGCKFGQSTIPSDCITFGEWFYNKVWRDYKNETWTMYGSGAKPFTLQQLFNIYLQEQNTQK